MAIYRSLHDPASASEVESLNDLTGRLPDEYVLWLRSHNGGQTDTSSVYWVPAAYPETDQMIIRDIFPVERATQLALLGGGFGESPGIHPSPMIGFAGNGGGDEFLISLLPDSWGSVWFCSMHGFESEEEANAKASGEQYWGSTVRLADSFIQFVESAVAADADFTGIDSAAREQEVVTLTDGLLTADGQYYLGQGSVLSVAGGGVVAGESETWTRDGGLHRVDGPAWVSGGGLRGGGSETWSVAGRRHREDGPAFERASNGGYEEWWLDGVRHRVDGPARVGMRQISVPVADKPGHTESAFVEVEEWFVNGRRHRLDGPAIQRGASPVAEASVEWWRDDKRHREDGPAFVSGGRELWFRENRLHREDGPAVIEPDGTEEFWVDGAQVTRPGLNGGASS